MEQNGDIDLEKLEPPPSIMSLQTGGDNPSVRRRRTEVVYSQLPEEADNTPPKPLDYTFRGRHVEMMAIGISVGTGVLYESGTYLWWGGPGSLLLSYVIMWTVLYAVMMSLREMITPFPIPGAVFTLAKRVLCPAIGFASGWIYFLSYAVDFPNKVSTAAAFMNLWVKDQRYVPLWIAIFFIVPILFNFLYVRRLGEIEYWFTTVKIILILVLIVTGILIAMGLSTDPLLGTSAQYTPVPCSANVIGECVPGPGLANWRQVTFQAQYHDGALGRLAGFWKCCTIAIFSYTGCESVGISADELERQRETLPRAVNRITSRIVYLYIAALLVLSVNLSANDPILGLGIENREFTSPGGFIVMVQRANIHSALADIINAVMIAAVVGVANADLYVASRSLYALARENQAPAFLANYTWGGVPYLALILPALFGTVAFIDVPKVAFGFEAFQLFSSITTTAILLSWAVICATYLRFTRGVRAQRLEKALEERANSALQPYLAIYGLFMSLFCAIFGGFEAFTRGYVSWSEWVLYWGFTLAPFGVIAGFVLLLVVSRFVLGSSAFQVEPESKIDLKTQRARKLAPLPASKFTLRTAIDRVLNY